MPVATLAKRASCDQATISMYVKGQRRMSERIARDVMSALVAEELSVLTHLARLHPQAAIESARAVSVQPPRAA
ncbi:MAG: hypothetical protein BGO20_00075 [Bosea sp. 67-29]|nr:MAG: hypothetical protein BGO20_00075 [Bosea sp. 67-29]